MSKWRYSRTQTLEIEVPTTIRTEGEFLVWLAETINARGTTSTVVKEFLSEAHNIDEPKEVPYVN